jgi:hypothetical protein
MSKVKRIKIYLSFSKTACKGSCWLLFLILLSCKASAQLTAYPVQDFNFGTFYQGSTGGSLTISTDGSRSSTGDVVLLNTGQAVSQAIFDIEAPENALISIVIGSNSTLYGSNGGTMKLEITGSNPATLFLNTAVPPDRSRVHFSGRLLIGDIMTSPPGIYQGTFSITFNNE